MSRTSRTVGAVLATGGLLVTACAEPSSAPPAFLPDLTTSTTQESSEPTTTTPTTSPPATSVPTSARSFDIIAWLAPDAPGPTLEQAVAAWDGVAEATYTDQAAAHAEFGALVGEGLVDGVDSGSLPSSLRVALEHPTYVGEVAGQLRELDDVESVVTFASPECSDFPGWDVVVFTFGDEALTRLRSRILATEGINEVAIWSADQNHAEFIERFADQPLAGEDVTPSDLGISLRATAANPSALTTLEATLLGDPAVRSVHVATGGTACG